MFYCIIFIFIFFGGMKFSTTFLSEQFTEDVCGINYIATSIYDNKNGIFGLQSVSTELNTKEAI